VDASRTRPGGRGGGISLKQFVVTKTSFGRENKKSGGGKKPSAGFRKKPKARRAGGRQDCLLAFSPKDTKDHGKNWKDYEKKKLVNTVHKEKGEIATPTYGLPQHN